MTTFEERLAALDAETRAQIEHQIAQGAEITVHQAALLGLPGLAGSVALIPGRTAAHIVSKHVQADARNLALGVILEAAERGAA